MTGWDSKFDLQLQSQRCSTYDCLSRSPSLRLSRSPSLRLSRSPSLRLSRSPSLRYTLAGALKQSANQPTDLSYSGRERTSCRVSFCLTSPWRKACGAVWLAGYHSQRRESLWSCVAGRVSFTEKGKPVELCGWQGIIHREGKERHGVLGSLYLGTQQQIEQKCLNLSKRCICWADLDVSYVAHLCWCTPYGSGFVSCGRDIYLHREDSILPSGHISTQRRQRTAFRTYIYTAKTAYCLQDIYLLSEDSVLPSGHISTQRRQRTAFGTYIYTAKTADCLRDIYLHSEDSVLPSGLDCVRCQCP